MRKSFRNALIILVIGAIAIMTLRASRERSDPIYKGKPLSVWLREYDPAVALARHQQPGTFRLVEMSNYTNGPVFSKPLERIEADEAVHHIGTDAIPMLLDMLRAQDSDLTLKLVGLAQKQHWIPVRYVNAHRRNECATEAFRALGAGASNAVPKLMAIYAANSSAESQRLILVSLGNIGPPAWTAIPFLLRVAATNTKERDWCLWALGEIHSEPEVVVPALTNLLHDPRRSARILTAQGLGYFGADAMSATSDILELLKDQDWQVRDSALIAICHIYGMPEWNPPKTWPPMIEYQPSELVRVINGLGTLGTNAASAVPALLKFLTDSDKSVRASATNALKAIDPQAAAKAGVQ